MAKSIRFGSMDGESFEVMAEITEGQNKQFIIDCNEMTVKFIKFQGIKRTATTAVTALLNLKRITIRKLWIS